MNLSMTRRLMPAALLGAVAVVTAAMAAPAAGTAYAGNVCWEEQATRLAADLIVPPCPPAKSGPGQTPDDGRDGYKKGIAPGNIL